LARPFHGIDELASASKERLMEVPSIGPKIAESIVAFFAIKENCEIIEKLRWSGVKLAEVPTTKPANEQPFAGMEFVITGTLKSLKRPDAEERIRTRGGTAGSAVNKKTAYLVVGEEPGSKLVKAQELGTKTLTEEEFLKLIGEKIA
jgi:DNA ligase (NAD+)